MNSRLERFLVSLLGALLVSFGLDPSPLRWPLVLDQVVAGRLALAFGLVLFLYALELAVGNGIARELDQPPRRRRISKG